MIEDILADFKRMVKSTNHSVLSSIEKALYKLFPSSSPTNPVTFASNSDSLHCVFGDANSHPINLHMHYPNSHGLLYVGNEDDSIQVQFKENGDKKETLSAYNLVGQYLLNTKILNGSGFEVGFDENLRQVVKT